METLADTHSQTVSRDWDILWKISQQPQENQQNPLNWAHINSQRLNYQQESMRGVKLSPLYIYISCVAESSCGTPKAQAGVVSACIACLRILFPNWAFFSNLKWRWRPSLISTCMQSLADNHESPPIFRGEGEEGWMVQGCEREDWEERIEGKLQFKVNNLIKKHKSIIKKGYKEKKEQRQG